MSTEERQKSVEIYGKNPNLIFISRDEISHRIAQEMYPHAKHLVYPDIVTSLIGTICFPQIHRKGVLFCLRNDKESYYSSKSIHDIMLRVSETEIVDHTDTTISTSGKTIQKDRKKYVLGMIDEFSTKEVIVTDRYHGIIFALAANTPIIMLKTIDHKLTAGLKWFPKSFEKYITFAKNIEEVPLLIKTILGKQFSYQLPPYFKNKYYDHLKKDLSLLSNDYR